MTVVDISLRRKSRVAVYLLPPPPAELEGAEYEGEKLLIDKTIIARCNISKGTELSLDDVKQLVYVSECYRAKERAIWLLSGQDYSEKGLYLKLTKTYTERAAAFAVSQMVSRGYISDERFAASVISKCKAKNMSKRGIAEKLAKSGVSREISDILLREENLSLTDLERATALIKSKYINKISTEENRKKTFAALMRRGFSYSDIKKAIELLSGVNEEIY